ncbi:hypothetical protein [Arsukibacterium indicum]|uniref:Uncharacterized protein n=1 Tax=Arsukibacterium indicum TaxID=2848612 RepID=A0ABS6MN72_9GAMM|nr:hypothetical protein [Arsukibacterium indicum]MBV2129752.1 hypothetical protein [Arsukibacterium indicum]
MDSVTAILGSFSVKTEYYIWLFIFINLLWFALFCFSKYAASKRYQQLQHSLNHELERRRKVYELKVCQYEDYCHELETFQLKHQNDYQSVFLPLYTEFSKRYQAADAAEDTAAASLATLWFCGEIQQVSSKNNNELTALDKKTAELTLSAADDVVEILTDIQLLCQKLLVVTTEQMNKLVAVALSKDHQAVKFMGDELQQTSSDLHAKTRQLMQEIRRDLLIF